LRSVRALRRWMRMRNWGVWGAEKIWGVIDI
jgi:hypothetical protein